jgi:hypothetical protein
LKHKVLFPVTVILAFLLCFSFALAQEAEKKEGNLDVKFNYGFHWMDWEDYKGKVGEYEDLKRDVLPDAGIDINGMINRTYLDFHGIYYDENDFSGVTDIDLNRIFREEFYYFRMPHFLEHDPLTNLNAIYRTAAGTPAAPALEFTDLDPNDEYRINYTRVESTSTLRIPFLPGSEIYFDYRKEMRKGHRQVNTLSKCSSCHVVSQSRDIDEYTEDFAPGFSTKFGNEKQGWLTLSYSYLKRRFGETGPDPENLYNPAVHPGTGNDVFTNRVQYDQRSGLLPFNVVPSSEKDSHTIKAHGQIPQIATDVFASYVNSSTKNINEENKSDLNSAIGRVTNSLIPGVTLSGKFRWLDIDNDDVFIEVYEQPVASPAGPPAVPLQYQGLYSQAYPAFDPTFDRESAMSRKVYDAELSAKYRLTRHLTLNGKFEWKSTDRDFYEVASDETKTTEYAGSAGLTFRKAGLYGKIDYEHREIEDPFANPKAACNLSVFQGAQTAFSGFQYFQLYNTRRLTLTNLPETKDQVDTSITWSISPYVSLNGNYRFLYESNDFGWDQQSHMPSASLWFTPSPKLNFSLSYLYNYQKTSSIICEPVFQG